MPHSPRALMLFAAGFGTRMGALTADCPKPLIAVAGKPLIDHALALTEGWRCTVSWRMCITCPIGSAPIWGAGTHL